MSYETTQISTELVNSGFVDKVFSGQTKEAQEAGSQYIRLKLYEDGILRRLFDNRTVTADELDPIVDETASAWPHAAATATTSGSTTTYSGGAAQNLIAMNDQPSIICELEPDATEATFVPFKGTGYHRYFNGKRFRVPFGKVEAQRIHKSKFELMTSRMPITDWLKENQVKAIQQEEDAAFIGLLKDIVLREAANASSNSVAPLQSATIPLSSTVDFKDAFTTGMKMMTKLRLPLGKALMHKNTFLDSLKLKIDAIGNTPITDRFNRGIEGEDSFLGVPVVTTIKDDLVPENEIWFFAPQDYFCKFYLLQDATLFMKTEADMIEFYTYEAPGMGIGNTRGVVKITLN